MDKIPPFPGKLGRPSTNPLIVAKTAKSAPKKGPGVKRLGANIKIPTSSAPTPKMVVLKQTYKEKMAKQEYEEAAEDSFGDSDDDMFNEPIVGNSTASSSGVSDIMPALRQKSPKSSVLPKSEKTIVTQYIYEIENNKNSSRQIELECKFMDIDAMSFNYLRSSYDVRPITTTDYVSGEYRRTAVVAGSRKTFSYMRKERLEQKIVGNFKFSLSAETPVVDTHGKEKDLLERSKKRTRVTVGDKYYLDMTEVCTTSTDDAGRQRTSTTYEIELELIPELPLEDVPSFQEYIDFAQTIYDSMQVDEVKKEILKKLAMYSNITSLLTKVGQLNCAEYYRDFYDKVSEKFFLTEKLDGRRALMYVNRGKQYLYFHPFTLKEEVDTEVEDSYIFDCEYYKGSPRIIDVVWPIKTGNIQSRIDQLPEFYKKIAKPYYKIDSIEALKDCVDKIYVNAENKVDGILFVDCGSSYKSTKVYKWKPSHLQTIDFYLHPTGKSKGLFTYSLCCSIDPVSLRTLNLKRDVHVLGDPADYFKMEFKPSSHPSAYRYSSEDGSLAGKIIEMVQIDGKWIPKGERVDKTEPNNFKVAESIYGNYSNPFTIDFLYSKSTYFPTTLHNKDKYRAYLDTMRTIASRALLNGAKICIDLGCGVGGDIHRYRSAGIQEILCIDSDKAAIIELASRRYIPSKSNNQTVIYTALATVGKDDIPEIFRTFDMSVPDRIIANFSAHYFMRTEKEMTTVLNQIDKILASGGKFCILSLSDKEVLDDYESVDKRYSISFEDRDAKIIKVLMPFSGEKMLEKLIDSSMLASVAEKCGFVLRTTRVSVPERTEGLNASDREYISKHAVHVLTRIPPKKSK